MDATQTSFEKLLIANSISLTSSQMKQFEEYFRILVEWNEKINLTAITEREQVYIKHFYDSISLSFFHPMDRVDNLADIGSGAGFPSLPLKIAFPHLQVTIVDSLQKRIAFLNHLISELGIRGVTAVHGRAEDISRDSKYRDSFDLVTARAVARLPVLNEFCLPFVKAGGTFIAMKGSDPEDEIGEAKRSLKELRGEIIGVHRTALPMDEAARHLVEIRKTGSTPGKYPRKAGTPLKEPIL